MEDLQRKIGGALARFMYGRNGWDQLNQALFRGYVVLLIAQLGARVLLRRPHL